MHKINNYDVSVLIKLKIFNLLSEDRGLWVMGIILNEKPPKKEVFPSNQLYRQLNGFQHFPRF